MDNSVRDLMSRADRLIKTYAPRDRAAAIMRAVRRNDFEALAPGSFTEDYPAPVIANRIDTMARDFVAATTLLPSFNCTPSNTLADTAKKFAAKRTRIANSYVETSRLQAQMPDATDHYNCYGLIAFEIVADLDDKRPRIQALDASMVYPVWDSELCTVEAVVVTYSNSFRLEAMFEDAVRTARAANQNAFKGDRIKLIKYVTAKEILVYAPEEGNTVLQRYPNALGECTIVAVPRPSGAGDWHSIPTGAYDHLVYPLLAENDLRILTLEAADKSVRSPIVVPMDVPDVPYGPDAVIHTNNPQGVQKLRFDVPTAAAQMADVIDRDIQQGGMSPSSRSGSVNASVITGRGIDALSEGYSSQIALAQQRIGFALRLCIEKCFAMDEKFWPNTEKEIRGQETDTAYRVTYIPKRDIAGDISVVVDYGFLLGLDANRALIFILQAQAAGLISTDTASKYLPMKLNLAEEASKIQLQQLRGSLISALSGTAQALPQMILQGADPSKIVASFAAIISGVKAGKEIEDIASTVFAPPPPAPATPGPGEPPSPGGAAAQTDATDANTPPGDAMAAMAGASPDAGGRPDLSQFMAGITARGPQLNGTVSRQRPALGA